MMALRGMQQLFGGIFRRGAVTFSSDDPTRLNELNRLNKLMGKHSRTHTLFALPGANFEYHY